MTMSQSTPGDTSFRGFETDVYVLVVGSQKQRLYVSADVLNKIAPFAEAIAEGTLTPHEPDIIEYCEPKPLATVLALVRDGRLKQQDLTSAEYCEAYGIALAFCLEAPRNTIMDLLTLQLLQDRDFGMSKIPLRTVKMCDYKVGSLLMRNTAYMIQQGRMFSLDPISSGSRKHSSELFDAWSKEDLITMMGVVACPMEDPIALAIRNPCLYHEHNETEPCDVVTNDVREQQGMKIEALSFANDQGDDSNNFSGPIVAKVNDNETAAAQKSGTLNILVVFVPRECSAPVSTHLQVHPHTTIRRMIRGFKTRYGVHADRDLQLFLNGKKLEESMLVSGVGLKDGDSVEVVMIEEAKDDQQNRVDILKDSVGSLEEQNDAGEGSESLSTDSARKRPAHDDQAKLLEFIHLQNESYDYGEWSSAQHHRKTSFTMLEKNTIAALAAEVIRLHEEVERLSIARTTAISDDGDLSSWASAGRLTPASTAMSDVSMSTIRGAEVEAFSLKEDKLTSDATTVSTESSPRKLPEVYLGSRKFRSSLRLPRSEINTTPQRNPASDSDHGQDCDTTSSGHVNAGPSAHKPFSSQPWFSEPYSLDASPVEDDDSGSVWSGWH